MHSKTQHASLCRILLGCASMIHTLCKAAPLNHILSASCKVKQDQPAACQV